MKKSIMYLFPVISVVLIVVTFFLPIVTYHWSPSSLSTQWFYGSGVLDFTFIYILDTPFIMITSITVVFLFLATSLIFLERKYPDRLNIVSNLWLLIGAGILILSILWILSWDFIVPFIAPYGFTFEFAIFLPFISGIVLILGRIYTFIFTRKTKK